MQPYLRSLGAPQTRETSAREKKITERKVSQMKTTGNGSRALDIPLRRPTWREDR